MKSFFKKYVPISFIITLSLAAVSFILLNLCEKNAALADGVSDGVGAFLRRSMAALSNRLSFSLAELLVILLVALIPLIIVIAFRLRTARGRVRLVLYIFSFAFFMYSWYALSFGASYHTSAINDKMDFDTVKVDEESLDSLAVYLVGELNSLSNDLTLVDGESVMPYSLSEMSEKIVLAYDAFLADYPIFDNLSSSVKGVKLSELMAYGGILGMYTYFSGEANLSVVYPDYCLPSAAIHELAHQRGVAREDEANFLAYTVASYSDDPYIRYSGCLSLFEYTVSALSKTNKERVKQIYSSLGEIPLSDLNAYSEFYREHMNTPLRDISSFFNDTYLRANGTEGVVSYGRAIRLSLAFYK